MAVYATNQDVEAAVGTNVLAVIADHDGDHAYDPDVLNAALFEASSLADTYLDAELPVPVPAPLALKRAVIDIAINYLREGRDLGTEGSRLAYTQAMKWLQAISDGKATLYPTDREPTPAGDQVGYAPGDPETDGLERVWSRSSARRVF